MRFSSGSDTKLGIGRALYAFDCVCIALIADISLVFSGKNYIEIAWIAVGGIIFCFRSVIHNPLQARNAFVELHIKAHNLPRFSAYHGHNVRVFAGF